MLFSTIGGTGHWKLHFGEILQAPQICGDTEGAGHWKLHLEEILKNTANFLVVQSIPMDPATFSLSEDNDSLLRGGNERTPPTFHASWQYKHSLALPVLTPVSALGFLDPPLLSRGSQTLAHANFRLWCVC